MTTWICLYILVRTPREGALDSTTILAISSLARQQADNLNTDFVRFEPVEFAEKLVCSKTVLFELILKSL